MYTIEIRETATAIAGMPRNGTIQERGSLRGCGTIEEALVGESQPGLVTYELCEVFLELGLADSKKAYPPPERPKDDEIFSRLVAAAER